MPRSEGKPHTWAQDEGPHQARPHEARAEQRGEPPGRPRSPPSEGIHTSHSATVLPVWMP